MKLHMKEYANYNETEILELYESVGWSNYTSQPEMLRNAYSKSLKILAAYDSEKLIGIIRVVGDGSSIVYIQDLLILPEYQRKGIGTRLLKEITSIYSNVYQKVLMTDNTEKTISFYKSMGYKLANEVGCVAVIIP